MKKVLGTYSAPRQHWVGDGFPVRSLFSYNTFGQQLSPFLLLDYAGPTEFKPTTTPRGVGQHPHRGFETVTIVYKGEVEHRDSSGGGGVIGPGDVQWMTAGGGIIHEEFHSHEYTKTGGDFEMVQLWVNLPAKDKMTPAHYQAIQNAQIPSVELKDGAGTLRVIAGEFEGFVGPAETYSPVDVWDVRLNAGKRADFTVNEGHTLAVIVLRGTVQVNDTQIARDAQMVVLDQVGTDFTVEANSDASFLILSGQPLNEPIEGYGPFVMNTAAQIHEAMQDFNSGNFGKISR
ncbi:pirin family protein [Aquirhabdus parva]|uniref:Pirin family protein n=1 Tax=Aquirhabdus parva TaxID=2283318 RepID=A0A345PAA6_9GAMM|nr:pirin family protein [Aquirhabdus parva]AXI04215.1 pirin family protein [Aquirhabdus parva]